MNARSSWIQEFWRIVILLGVAWAAGYVLDQQLLAILFALIAYTLRNLFNLQRLTNWLGDPRVDAIPIHFGLWGDIYSRIARLAARQEQRERRLATLLKEYSASTSALPDATVALDQDSRISWFNEAASRLLGLQAGKDIGQRLSNLFRNPELSAFLLAADYSARMQTSAPGDSERKLEIRLAPYGEGQTLLLAQDITERVRQDRVRRDFVANVSHELRTPLTVLSGFIENLQDDETVDARKIRRPLELMEQQAHRMRQLVEDLLLLARLENSSMAAEQQPVVVGDLLQSVADECAAIRADGPQISCRIASQRRLLADPKQLRSAITNLVVNAVHHTPAQGEVELVWSDEGTHSLIEVIDDGEGIAAEHIPRLTERFYRVDTGRSRERGGTGLGLAIVKHILMRHDARLQISSKLGSGSRFVCDFPSTRLLD